MKNYRARACGRKKGGEAGLGDELLPLFENVSRFGMSLSASQAERFRIYLDELWQWSRKTNLTGISSREGIVVDLFLESIIPGPFLPEKGKVLDMGTGGGFPGIPLKICRPNLSVVLVESKQKKVNFLKHVIRLLGLRDIEVFHTRIEKTKSRIIPPAYQVVTARAMASLEKTLELGAPYLVEAGLLVSFQGQHIQRIMESCNTVMNQCGLFLYRNVPYVLPGRQRKRHIVIFRKRAVNRGQTE